MHVLLPFAAHRPNPRAPSVLQPYRCETSPSAASGSRTRRPRSCNHTRCRVEGTGRLNGLPLCSSRERRVSRCVTMAHNGCALPWHEPWKHPRTLRRFTTAPFPGRAAMGSCFPATRETPSSRTILSGGAENTSLPARVSFVRHHALPPLLSLYPQLDRWNCHGSVGTH